MTNYYSRKDSRIGYKDVKKKRAYQNAWYKKNIAYYTRKRQENKNKTRAWFYTYKSKLQCKICGESESCCLDFHHLNPHNKKFAISKAVSEGNSISLIQKEIDKCICLCANCHRKLHAGLIEICSGRQASV